MAGNNSSNSINCVRSKPNLQYIAEPLPPFLFLSVLSCLKGLLKNVSSSDWSEWFSSRLYKQYQIVAVGEGIVHRSGLVVSVYLDVQY